MKDEKDCSAPTGIPPALAFTVYGKPAPAGSKTVGFAKSGKHFVRDSAKGSAEWKRAVAQVAGDKMGARPLLEGPLTLCVDFYLPRPQGHFGKRGLLPSAPLYPMVAPDATKLLRAVEDALQGICFRNDAQIVTQTVVKRYGEPTRCEIVVARTQEGPLVNADELEGGDITATEAGLVARISTRD